MKNKLSISINKFPELHSSGDSDESGKEAPRDSPAPTIIVCPPMEDDRLSPGVGARGSRLLRALSRRISRRRADDDVSSESSDETAWSADRERGSFSASEGSSEAGSERPRARSSSLCRIFQSLSIARPQSCSVDRARSKKNPQPKRILRQPVTYTYVRGLSGLTQRVPRPRVSGLNR